MMDHTFRSGFYPHTASIPKLHASLRFVIACGGKQPSGGCCCMAYDTAEHCFHVLLLLRGSSSAVAVAAIADFSVSSMLPNDTGFSSNWIDYDYDVGRRVACSDCAGLWIGAGWSTALKRGGIKSRSATASWVLRGLLSREDLLIGGFKGRVQHVTAPRG